MNRFRGKDLNAIVTNCDMNAKVGTKCLAWAIFAAQQRINLDGTVTNTASLELTKFSVKIIKKAPGYVATPVANGVSDSVNLSVSDQLASATASGVVSVQQCNKNGKKCTSTNVSVSVQLTANAAADFNKGRSVTKFGNCRISDRFNSQSRTADGSAQVNGETFVTTPVAVSRIDSSVDTTVFRNCPAPPPGP